MNNKKLVNYEYLTSNLLDNKNLSLKQKLTKIEYLNYVKEVDKIINELDKEKFNLLKVDYILISIISSKIVEYYNEGTLYTLKRLDDSMNMMKMEIERLKELLNKIKLNDNIKPLTKEEIRTILLNYFNVNELQSDKIKESISHFNK